ncbi:hypothetical protein FD754_005907 [Muntiacus muntjak]|uniref:Uncharacterized protein n=1 Tax=Muntiacus muntjak TaxID=9888 RepID=A0A5N3WJ18_MUNMU|nr:hypothetical protein FD754_005907 [Muntiacus muntjak]
MTHKIKKPPVAPKPKFVVATNKPTPPPVAPKPEILVSSVPQSTKKTKPAIAPKPKVLKASPVQDITQSPSRKIVVNLEENSQEFPESTDNSNCRNRGHPSSDCILPVCSCHPGCNHKLENRENLCVKQLVFGPLEMHENLENNKIGESPSAVKNQHKCDSVGERVKSQSKVVLKASILEEKLKDVLTQRTSPFLFPQKHRSTDSPEMSDGCNSHRQFSIEFADLSPSLSSFENISNHHPCHLQLPSTEFQNFQVNQNDSEKNNTCYHSSEQEALESGKRSPFLSSDGDSKKSEAKDLGPLEIHLVPCTPKFPTPKPRKTRVARLLRQRHIDTPSENTEEPGNVDNLPRLFEDNLKNNKISVFHQTALCNQEQVDKVKPETKSELNVDFSGDRQNLVCSQKALCPETISSEETAPLLETDSNLGSDDKSGDSSGMSLAEDKGTNFIRCSTLSMSLPKQLKLTCNEYLPTASNPGVSAPQMQKESIIKDESSSKIVPKKPQRHSLPAAGVLKKAASEELVEKSSYPANEEKDSEKGLERDHLQHLCAPNNGMSSSFDMPKRASEKPVWKLPHPIIPFSGNPESLKSVTISSNSETPRALTKPRAKSLSAMDVERCTKPCKDSHKKNSFKKLLNMKLSICFMKSDFQKFWSKNSQLGDTTSGSLAGGEQKVAGGESDWHGLLIGEEKRGKAIKAYSADNYSLESHKKRKKLRGQTSAANGPRAESLDDQMLSRESSFQPPCKSVTSNCAPEYENIRHYEEIPEYENLPFVMAMGKTPELEWQNSSSVEDTDTNVYEVQEPYEAPDGQLQLGPRHQHSSLQGPPTPIFPLDIHIVHHVSTNDPTLLEVFIFFLRLLTSMGYHSLLQGIFLTRRLNPGLLHCRWILYHLSLEQGGLSRLGSPKMCQLNPKPQSQGQANSPQFSLLVTNIIVDVQSNFVGSKIVNHFGYKLVALMSTSMVVIAPGRLSTEALEIMQPNLFIHLIKPSTAGFEIGVSVVKNGNNHAMFAFDQVSGGCYSERVKMSFTGSHQASLCSNSQNLLKLMSIKSEQVSLISWLQSLSAVILDFLHNPTLTSIHDHWKNHSLGQMDLCWQTLSQLFHSPLSLSSRADFGNLISGSSAFSKSSLTTWKFTFHVLLKPGLENFEHYFTSV